MKRRVRKAERRSAARLRAHYEIEKALATRLKEASREARRTLYTAVYDEMYRRVPDHPQLVRKQSPEQQKVAVAQQMRILRGLLDAGMTFLEVGTGDGALARHVAARVRKVYAVDVSPTVTASARRPDNLELILSDGCSIPVPAESVDLAYSNQLMEHLHPDDAQAQLRNIHDALVPGGVYLCVTPNRLNGPHDISRYFDSVATGFHLKEYTVTELNRLFRRVGFDRVSLLTGAKGWYLEVPVWPAMALEAVLERFPPRVRRVLAGFKPVARVIDIRMLGRKGGR